MTAELHVFTAGTHGYLLVDGAQSLLIDCPAYDLDERIRAAGLPLPQTVLHTQVQEEHCREWAALPAAEVYVPEASREVALRSPLYYEEAQTLWPPDRPWAPEDRGYEKYTIAGAVAERPPQRALRVAGVLRPGEVFTWGGLTLEVLDLPGSGKRACGLYWREEKLLFSGDLLAAGGYLVNFHDLERAYGPLIGHREAVASLQTVIELAPARALPSTGAPVEEPVADAERLVRRLRELRRPSYPTVENHRPAPRRTFHIFREQRPGLYQCKSGGPLVLYVDGEGRGLCVDPDICVWEDWQTNERLMHEALDALEAEAGLRRVEWALITHAHADHMEYAGLLRERYGTTVAATPDVAELLLHPRRYPYACLLHWYDLPFDSFAVDRRLDYEETLDWHGVPVTAVHAPGHSWAQAGYLVPWDGELTACVGDSLQPGMKVVSPHPVLFNDAAWPRRSPRRLYRRLRLARAGLILGGHGTYMLDPDGKALEAFLALTDDLEARLRGCLPAGADLGAAMTPPGFDSARQRLAAAGRVRWESRAERA
jgi:glyoxylase-like metal-dependent hydrolase (beta-lactamase superfamily II)